MNKAGCTLKISSLGVIIKLFSMSFFAILKKGVLSLVYAEIINIFFVVFLSFYTVCKTITKVGDV